MVHRSNEHNALKKESNYNNRIKHIQCNTNIYCVGLILNLALHFDIKYYIVDISEKYNFV